MKMNNIDPVLPLGFNCSPHLQLNNLQRTKGPPYLKNKLPPRTLKVSTVSVRKRKQFIPLKKSSSHLNPISLPGLKYCNESRPPINPELAGPTVFSYDPPKDPPQMTSFPAYTFRPKTQSDRIGGERTAWGKEWFSHNFVWLQKADFDPRLKWPSPAHYNIKSTFESTQPVFPRSSSHTFGKRDEISFARKGTATEPGPDTYQQDRSKDRIMRSQICFTIPQGRRKGTVLWGKKDSVPGPGSYETSRNLTTTKPKSTAFTFSMSPRKFDLETRWTL